MHRRTLAGLLIVGAASAGAWSAPLFPDVSEQHWAKDAVAALAAKGLLEGYPDGTFKGDRAASRWEVAMIVARLLAKMEQAHATFATKAELDEIRKLAAALKDELDALGVRVTNVEQNVDLLDKRVVELERITFYGSFDTKIFTQTLYSTGNTDNDNKRGGNGTGPVPFTDYNTFVGSALGPPSRLQNTGVIPVVDYRYGRALLNGASFTSKAILGMKVLVSPDVDAGLEFAAYSSQGNGILGAYWGISAPYLQSASTALQTADAGIQGLNNAPYTRMVLDNFWMIHKPSKTKLILGSIDKTLLDPLVYAGLPNLNALPTSPKRYIGYGFDVSGQVDFNDNDRLRWEALGSRWGDGDFYAGDGYQKRVLGAVLAYQFGAPIAGRASAGEVKFNYVRFWDDESSASQPLLIGFDSLTNVNYGASSGWTPFQWVNPPGYFANQRSPFEVASTATSIVKKTYVPNTFDTRPIPGWNGGADNGIGISKGGGNFGPEDQTTLGLSARYEWGLNPDASLRVVGQFAHSIYKPNRNSTYSSEGDAMRAELGTSLCKGNLDLAINYLSVDPTYSPAIPAAANLLGARNVLPFNFTGRYYLHDFSTYPSNREGVQFKGKWSFADKHAELNAKVGFLNQKETSLYDVRVLGGSLGPGIPTNDVIGFSPGFTDPVFAGFAHPALYGGLSSNSFNANLQPMENPRGHENNYGLGFSYKWDNPSLKLDAKWEHNSFDRATSLAANFGGSQNMVHIGTTYALLGLGWNIDDKHTLRGGMEYVTATGHFDPGGLYNGFAVKNNSVSFTNVDSSQAIPFLGFDMTLNKDISWSSEARYFFTTDHVSSDVFAGPGEGGRGFSEHPFSWAGPQFSTEFHVKF